MQALDVFIFRPLGETFQLCELEGKKIIAWVLGTEKKENYNMGIIGTEKKNMNNSSGSLLMGARKGRKKLRRILHVGKHGN